MSVQEIWNKLEKNRLNPDLVFELARAYQAQNRFLRAKYLAEQCTLGKGPVAEQGRSLLVEIQGKLQAKGKNKGISLCMIVKNEEAALPRCLKSAEPYVDEIIVVDTGSTDQTVDIAKSFGARVESFIWINDFSAARNESLKHAMCEYVLWLDADDMVPPGQEALIRKVTNEPTRAAYFAKVCSIREGSDQPHYNQLRIFPNRSDVRFEQRIHEQIVPSLVKASVPICETDFAITHTGYHCADIRRQKARRNVEMVSQELVNDPGNVTLAVSLGDSLYVCDEYEEAAKAYQHAIDIKGSDQKDLQAVLQARVNQAQCLIRLDRLDESFDSLRALLKKDPQKADGLFLAGQVAMRKGDSARAVEFFQQAINAPERIGTTTVDYANIRRTSLLRLIGLLRDKQDWQDMLDYSQKGMEQFPQVLDFWITSADGLFGLGKYVEALDLYEKSIQASPGTVRRAYAGKASCFLVGKDKQAALQVLKQGLAQFPDDERMLELLGDIHYDNREPGDALICYKTILEYKPADTALLWKAASCAADLKQYAASLTYVRAVLKLEPENAQARKFVGDLEKLVK